LLLSAIAGPEARSPIALGEAGRRFAGRLDRDVDGVRVAWWTDLGGVPFDPVVRQVVDEQRAVFESRGCIVEMRSPISRCGRRLQDTARRRVRGLAIAICSQTSERG
jgi:amidase